MKGYLESESIEIIREAVANSQNPVMLYSIDKNSSVMPHPGETIRVLPMSNWTEADIWQYIASENISIVPLYFAARGPVVKRCGLWFMADDKRFQLNPGEAPGMRMVHFRTMGSYPLAAAVESEADTHEAVIDETLASGSSERPCELIAQDGAGSMARKQQEGYF